MPKIREFVARYVETVEELETLAALAALTGGEGQAWVDVASLAAQTKLEPSSFGATLGALASRHAIELADDGRRTRLALDAGLLADLLSQYRSNPVAVLKLLNALAIQRLRSGATRAFADAFLLRRKDSDG